MTKSWTPEHFRILTFYSYLRKKSFSSYQNVIFLSTFEGNIIFFAQFIRTRSANISTMLIASMQYLLT